MFIFKIKQMLNERICGISLSVSFKLISITAGPISKGLLQTDS